MAIEMVEGDFVIKAQGKVFLRAHFTAESLMIATKATGMIICTISEAKELRDWLTRRLEEDIG